MQNRIVFVQLPYPAVLIYMDRENIVVKLIRNAFSRRDSRPLAHSVLLRRRCNNEYCPVEVTCTNQLRHLEMASICIKGCYSYN